MRDYHDHEWGVPSHDDRHLFEMLTLEGAQAGLSWATILNRREGYRRAFANFDPVKVAAFDDHRRNAWFDNQYVGPLSAAPQHSGVFGTNNF